MSSFSVINIIKNKNCTENVILWNKEYTKYLTENIITILGGKIIEWARKC